MLVKAIHYAGTLVTNPDHCFPNEYGGLIVVTKTVNSDVATAPTISRTLGLNIKGLVARALSEFAFLFAAVGRARVAVELSGANAPSNEIYHAVYERRES